MVRTENRMNVLCFDVGGTSIKYALMDKEAKILEKGSFDAVTDSMESFLSSIKEVYESYKGRFEGVSFSMPGVIDPDSGFFYTGGAYDHFIHNINMKEVFHTFIEEPLIITNDAKCAAYGELGFGCLKDVSDAAVLVLGTGIGGCLIKDRKPIYGKHLYSGEFSFINIHSTSDPTDTFAFQCGVSGLLKRVQTALNTDAFYTGKDIFAMANEGNETVLKALHEFCFDLACQIYNLSVIYDPEVFAIGGGISAQKLLFDELDKCFDEIKEHYGPLFFNKPEIRVCKHRNDANLMGALYRYIVEIGSSDNGIDI